MIALSPEELALLRLMAEVGVPLRDSLNGRFFPGQQHRHVSVIPRLAQLCNLGMLRILDLQGTVSTSVDYALTDKGRETAKGEGQCGPNTKT